MDCYYYHLKDSHLPKNFNHKIIESENDKDYVLKVNIKCMTEIDKWLLEFQKNSETQWNRRTSKPGGSQKIWREVVCHHSSFMKVDKDKNKRGVSKNACCGARIRITIQMPSLRNRNTEFMKANLWATILISKRHTHSLNSAQTLRFLQARNAKSIHDDDNETVREIFCDYFADNMTASEAKNHHQKLLELRNASEAELANGRINPTNDSIQYWFKEWRKLNLGPRTGERLIAKLIEKKDVYAKEGIIVAFEEEPLCICVITPIMRRAHALPSAKEHLFIDSTSSCDPGHHSLTFLLTSCPAGSVPLGLLITKGQTAAAYTTGFKLFQRSTREFAFGNQGYPTTILTDNSAAEIAAIKETWPNSSHFLCVFHILQAVWRWLYNADNKIHHDDRTTLMIDFKRILRTQDCVELQSAYEECLENGSKYPHWIKYMQDYWSFKEKWALAYRDEKIRGHHTNNFSEANIRIFKDIVLSRVKAYNVISLVDFCATGLEQYHVTKLREFANFRSRRSYLFFQNCLKKTRYLTADDIIPIDNHSFLVPSESTSGNSYTVDCEIGSCSCPEGRFGKFCKHQCAIFQFFELPFVNFPPITRNERYMMAKVALGEDKVPHISFYDNFVEESHENKRNPLVAIENFSTEGVSNNDIENAMLNASSGEHSSGTDNDLIAKETNELRDSILQILSQKISNHEPCPELNAALKQYKKRLNGASTNGLLLQFLYAAGAKRFKSGAKIGVQPTSLSRRRPDITRGSRRIASGRIAKETPRENSKTKRRHNFKLNVALSQRN